MGTNELPHCTGVIVPGYSRGEALCPTPYIPNRYPVVCPRKVERLPQAKQVRIVYSGNNFSQTPKAEVQVSDGNHWVVTQEVDLRIRPGLLPSVGYRVDSEPRPIACLDPSTDSSNATMGLLRGLPVPDQEPVSLCSVKNLPSDEFVAGYQKKGVIPFDTQISIEATEKLEGSGDKL